MRTPSNNQSMVLGLSDRATYARFRCADATPKTTIAAGSSGASAPAVLDVASNTNWPFAGTGVALLSTGGYGIFTWTGKGANSLSGCAWNTTTALASTGGAVYSTPDYTMLGGANGTQGNWLVDVAYQESVDQYIASATIHIKRDNFAQSLSPLLAGSIYNQTGQALALNRECWIEIAQLPMNSISPVASDWTMVFHGFIDTIDWGNDPITITATDQAAQLQKTQIQIQRNYGVWDTGHTLIAGYRAQASTQVASPPSTWNNQFWFEVTTPGVTQGGIWNSLTAYGNTVAYPSKAIGDCVVPTVPDPQGQQRFFFCTTAGTSGSSEPVWPAFGSGSPTVTDGTVTWTLFDPDSASSPTPDPLAAWCAANAGGGGNPAQSLDGTTIAEYGGSNLVWTVRVPKLRLVNHAYAVNTVIQVVNGSLVQYWICTTSGTSTTTNSTAGFPTTPTLGQVVTDNTASGGTGSTVVWSPMGTPGGNLAETVIQQILKDNNQRISLTLVAVPLSFTGALASPSGGATLPVTTLTLANTGGLPAAGSVIVPLTAGTACITYTGISGDVLTGCAGGTGTLAANGSTVTASTPNTGLYFGPYTQQQEDALSAVTALALQIGYDIRMLWNSTTGDFSLTMSYVNRSASVPVTSFAANYYTDLPTLKEDIQYIRNVVAIVYTDNSILNGAATSNDPTINSTPQRKQIIVPTPQTSASISAYGVLYCSISEGSSLQTDNLTSATNFANAVLADLSQPVLEHSVAMKYQFNLQMNDLIEMIANNVHYDSNQNQAIVSQSHSISLSQNLTTLGLRGNPTAGYAKYHNKVVADGNAYPPVVKHGIVANGVKGTGTYQGGTVYFNPPMNPWLKWQFTEVHLSTISGFVPSASTQAVGSPAFSGSFTPTGLVPGVTYYCKLVHRFDKNTASNPSPQIEFVAKGANASVVLANVINTSRGLRQCVFDTELFDTASAYATGTGIWTPTSPGTYAITITVTAVFAGVGSNPNTAQIGLLENVTSIYQQVGPLFSNAAAGVTATLQANVLITAAMITAGHNFGVWVNLTGNYIASTTVSFEPLATSATFTSATLGCAMQITQQSGS